MSVYFPQSVNSVGTDTWTFVVALAIKTAATVAELSAVSACDLQNSFRPGFGVAAETERINDERQGAEVSYQLLGTTSLSFSDMVLIDRPQDADAAATKKHLTVLASGAVGYLINRRGIGSGAGNWVAWATTQKYIGYPVQVGPQVPLAPGDSKAFERSISFAVTGPSFNGTVAA